MALRTSARKRREGAAMCLAHFSGLGIALRVPVPLHTILYKALKWLLHCSTNRNVLYTNSVNTTKVKKYIHVEYMIVCIYIYE